MPSIPQLIRHCPYLQWVSKINEFINELNDDTGLIRANLALQMELNKNEPVVWNTIQGRDTKIREKVKLAQSLMIKV